MVLFSAYLLWEMLGAKTFSGCKKQLYENQAGEFCNILGDQQCKRIFNQLAILQVLCIEGKQLVLKLELCKSKACQ